MLLSGRHPGSWFGWITLIHTCSVCLQVIVKPERGQATLIWERKSPETADQPQTNAHFPLHATLARERGFFPPLLLFPLGSIRTSFPTGETVVAPTDIQFSLLRLGISRRVQPSPSHPDRKCRPTSIDSTVLPNTPNSTPYFATFGLFSGKVCLPPVSNSHIWWSGKQGPPHPLVLLMCVTCERLSQQPGVTPGWRHTLGWTMRLFIKQSLFHPYGLPKDSVLMFVNV